MRYFACFIKTPNKIFSSIPALSLLIGLFWFSALSTDAQAGLLSSILGDEVHAQADKAIVIPPSKSSQTMSLLEVNASNTSIFQGKDEKKDTKKDTPIDTNATVNIVSDNAMLASASPMGVGGSAKALEESSLETSVYVVREGDSMSVIAEMFDVSVNTILWANNMKKNDKLVPGDVLFILPVSGLEHTVAKGQTLQSIAKLYKVDVIDIIQANDGVTEETKLVVGDKLMVPDAVRAEESDKPIQNLAESSAKDKKYYDTHPVQNLSGYYINPVPGYRKSQGIHDRNGVDLAIPQGSDVHAAAAGTVTLARLGYNGGFGGLITIKHANGTETLYAHLSKLNVSTGSQVFQGQVIGLSGGKKGSANAGRSTGPHLHFEVHGARNPGTDGSWKY